MLFTFFRYLVAKQKMENSKENNNENKADSEAANKTEKEYKIEIEKKKLEQALKNARLEHQVIIRIYLFSIQFS